MANLSVPTKKPSTQESSSNVGFNPVVQIGPDVSGENFGYFLGASCTFYLGLGQGDPTQTYAWYSTTSGSTWVPIPNNQQVQASGGASVQWAFNAPQGVTFKFLMGPS